MSEIQLDLTPEEYHSEPLLRAALAGRLKVGVDALPPFRVTRRSIDCRRRNVLYHCTIAIGLNTQNTPVIPNVPAVNAPRVVIVGAGPAGLFAALRALELGMKPIIVERGKPVEERKKDIVSLVRTKQVDPNSNWCFGEGGAGTYSDGRANGNAGTDIYSDSRTDKHSGSEEDSDPGSCGKKAPGYSNSHTNRYYRTRQW